METQDGTLKCSYYDYLKKHQKSAWWTKMIASVKRFFKSKEKEVKYANKKGIFTNPYYLSKKENEIVEAVRSNIELLVNKKTGVITICVEAQDPFVCKNLADSVSTQLQKFITNYRTQKARHDVDYYKYELDRSVPFIIWTKDEKLEKLGFTLPFMVKLSHNLILYDLLDRVYFDEEEAIDKLWE